MSFLDSIVETVEEERERLALSPEGSTNRYLSEMPVNVKGFLFAKVIRLPRFPDRPERDVVVVPVDLRGSQTASRTEDGRSMRNAGSWSCVVVHSNNNSYPVGGFNIIVPEAELVRGDLVVIEPMKGGDDK